MRATAIITNFIILVQKKKFVVAKKRMNTPKAIAIFVPTSDSFVLAKDISDAMKNKILDPSSLFDDATLTSSLGEERIFCTTSEAALALSQYGSAVILGPTKFWGEKRGKHFNMSLFAKLSKMLVCRSMTCVFLLPGDTTTVVPIEVARALFENVPHDSIVITHNPTASATDVLQHMDGWIGNPTEVIGCNQVRVMYALDGRVKHETVFFDAQTPHMMRIATLPPISNAPFMATRVEVEDDNGFSFVALPPREFDDILRTGQHITLNPGKNKSKKSRPPATMRIAAKAVENKEEFCHFGEDDIVPLDKLKLTPIEICPVTWAFEAFPPARVS